MHESPKTRSCLPNRHRLVRKRAAPRISRWQAPCCIEDVTTEAPRLLDSPPKARIHALFTRIQLLEQHALRLEMAFRTEAMRADVRAVISTLHRAEAWLGDVPTPDVLAELEDLMGSVSQQISGLGRAK
jgi:hypothetical protein